jgi:glutamine amidotransferase
VVVKNIVVLDYGSGNLRSAQRAVERVGAQVTVTADRDAAIEADGLLIPGVGAYAACMDGLLGVGGDRIVSERIRRGRGLLAICVGMQILFDLGVEHGDRTRGLGVLPGAVERLDAPVLPHMGWNTVDVAADSRLFGGIDTGTRFYFVHSYAAPASVELRRIAAVTTSRHGTEFAAAVEAGVVSATQFHPEKSADAGAELLRNWLSTL